VTKQEAYVSRAGYGKPGYCKICAFEGVGEINKLIKLGRKVPQIKTWVKANYDGFDFDRQVLYKHRDEHVAHPKDQLVAVSLREQAKVVATEKPKATNDEFLEAVRDIGFRRAEMYPDEVTVDHALKAASIMANKRDKASNVFLMMAQIVTGPRPQVVEGTFTEVQEE